MTTALIVIDMQNDFCPGGKLAVAEGSSIIGEINALMAAHEVTVLTQDWHPADHRSFASQHGAAPYSVTQMPYGPQVLWPDHCVQGSEGAAFHPDLACDKADLVLRKGFRPEIDSYSAFFENDKTTPTGLHGYLQERGVKELVFCGLALDFCVAWSALDAVRLGYKTTVQSSACRGIDLDGSMEAALGQMRAAGVVIT